MDITETIAPRSDQINAEDLLTGPRTFTVEKVTAGSVEQPVEIHLVGLPGRPFKPSKTVRRLLVAAWGPEANVYAGRRMTLYRDAEITFGRDKVGGIRVSHLSDIERRIQIALTVTRGKRSPFVVEPLAPMSDEIVEFDLRIASAQSITDLDAIAREIKAKGNQLGEHRAHLQAAWKARRDVLEAQPPTVEADLAVDELQLESQ
jgi:hypothetical protein